MALSILLAKRPTTPTLNCDNLIIKTFPEIPILITLKYVSKLHHKIELSSFLKIRVFAFSDEIMGL